MNARCGCRSGREESEEESFGLHLGVRVMMDINWQDYNNKAIGMVKPKVEIYKRKNTTSSQNLRCEIIIEINS